MDREALTAVIALTVSAVWAVAAIASFVVRDYTALGIVTPVMLIVAGFLFGLRTAKNNNSGNGGRG